MWFAGMCQMAPLPVYFVPCGQGGLMGAGDVERHEYEAVFFCPPGIGISDQPRVLRPSLGGIGMAGGYLVFVTLRSPLCVRRLTELAAGRFLAPVISWSEGVWAAACGHSVHYGMEWGYVGLGEIRRRGLLHPAHHCPPLLDPPGTFILSQALVWNPEDDSVYPGIAQFLGDCFGMFSG